MTPKVFFDGEAGATGLNFRQQLQKCLLAVTMTAAVVAAGCATAPKTPEELIVGTWGCVLSRAAPDLGIEYVATFRQSRSMKLRLEGRFDIGGIDVDVDMSAEGSYRLTDNQISGSFEKVATQRLMIDGEPPDDEMLALVESIFADVATDAANSTVAVLDEDQLILLIDADDESLSCKRRAT